MGESKRRVAAREQLNEAIMRVDIPRLAAAIRKLATAASGQVGADCFAHAAIAQAILIQLDVEARLVVGYAALRVGDGDGDVILHAPAPGMVEQPGGVPYPYPVQIIESDFISAAGQSAPLTIRTWLMHRS
jgi:hypothetical protein